jgi:bile acid-coenzyme A ligase
MRNLPTDTHLVPVPLSHNTGMTSATLALLTGQHLVLMRRFDPETSPAADRCASRSTIWRRCRRSCSACCRSTVPTPTPTTCPRCAGCWHLAAPCPPNIKEAWIELLGPDAVWELYGGTELALTFIAAPSG